MSLLLLSTGDQLIDVIVRTKNPGPLLRECLKSVCAEIPVRRIIIVDAGSTDQTQEIALTYHNVDFHVKPELNLGQATQFGFSKAQTEWVAIIDSDIVLQKGWFNDMKKYMDGTDAIEGGRIDHYSFNVRIDSTSADYGRFGQTLLKREPVLHMDMHVPFGSPIDFLPERTYAMENRHTQDIDAMREEMKQQFKKIMSMVQKNPILSQAKPDALVRKELSSLVLVHL